jgi:hypothetical protein
MRSHDGASIQIINLPGYISKPATVQIHHPNFARANQIETFLFTHILAENNYFHTLR